MGALPEGTVTFLFSDVEGSTRLLERHGAEMGSALARHHALFEEVVERRGGVIFETVGDGVYSAFARPTDAAAAALDAHRALAGEDWGPIGRLAVRIAIHTGVVERRGDHYFGSALFRVARLQALAHGEQTLLSGVTAGLLADGLPEGASLRDLGSHRLKDLGAPERVYQLEGPELRADFPPLRSLDAHPHNLPVQLSSFVGREAELAEVAALLDAHRLVTLLGPGGIGKTRLGLQVAADRLERHPDGVFFVDVAPIREPEFVQSTIATTLGLHEQPGRTIDQLLHEHLADRQLLLVLDNLEQLLPAAAPTVAELLGAAPQLCIIATSRAPLRVRGEHRYVVPTLASGDPGQLEATPPPAVALFAERARELEPNFTVDDMTGPLIADICARLDGLPLAIELAVARLPLLGLAALRERLVQRLPLLTDGARDLPERQQTLRDAIAWSTELLGEPERRLFARLGVFAGSFNLEAVEAVCGPELGADMVTTIDALLSHSLVRRSDRGPGGEPRFAMLETIQEYAVERLEEASDSEEVRRRNTDYWVEVAEDFEASIIDPRVSGGISRSKPDDLMARLRLDYPNLRATLTELTRRRDQEPALRMIAGMSIFWNLEGRWREGLELGTRALAVGKPRLSPSASDALHRIAILHLELGDRAGARPLYERALEMRLAIGDLDRIESTLHNLGNVADGPEEAVAYYEQSLAIKRKLGSELHDTMWNIAMIRFQTDDLHAARVESEQVVDLARKAGDHGVLVIACSSLGRLAQYHGDLPTARRTLEAALEAARQTAWPWDLVNALVGLASCDLHEERTVDASGRLDEAVALVRDLRVDVPLHDLACLLESAGHLSLATGDPRGAAEAWGGVHAMWRAVPHITAPFRQRQLDALVQRAQECADSSAFSAAWTRGTNAAPEQQVELADRLISRATSRLANKFP